MANYGLFIILATLTVLSPGPGVVLTISNSLRHGWTGSLPGIFGIALGAFVVAGISASSVGVILATSATAFTLLKYVGAAYLLYLGIKMWRATSFIPRTQSHLLASVASFFRGVVDSVAESQGRFLLSRSIPSVHPIGG